MDPYKAMLHARRISKQVKFDNNRLLFKSNSPTHAPSGLTQTVLQSVSSESQSEYLSSNAESCSKQSNNKNETQDPNQKVKADFREIARNLSKKLKTELESIENSAAKRLKMKNYERGRATVNPLTARENKDKDKLMMSKTMKDLNKGSNLATRFMDTVQMVNNNFIRSSDREIELLPILREAQLRHKKPRPTGAQLGNQTPYIAPLDRKTYD